jgi:uncharacterized membrane protein
MIGSTLYGSMELLFRGWTHWCMLLCGGLCFLLLYFISNFMNERLWRKWVMGAFVITTVEFLFGIVFNIILEMRVWDYSHYRYNLMGQISLIFTIFWLILCIPGVRLCEIIRKYFYSLHY